MFESTKLKADEFVQFYTIALLPIKALNLLDWLRNSVT
jgi:hypothetical protein